MWGWTPRIVLWLGPAMLHWAQNCWSTWHTLLLARPKLVSYPHNTKCGFAYSDLLHLQWIGNYTDVSLLSQYFTTRKYSCPYLIMILPFFNWTLLCAMHRSLCLTYRPTHDLLSYRSLSDLGFFTHMKLHVRSHLILTKHFRCRHYYYLICKWENSGLGPS